MADPAQKPAVNNLPIEVPPELQPAYANLARIAHAPAEFVVDFARILPGDSRALVTARVVMSPIALKLFAQAVTENLARYEATFGSIHIPSGSPASLADSLFKPHHPPEPPEDPPKDAK